MRKLLDPQIGCNVEAYIDNIVMKSQSKESLIDDLRETFANLRKVQLMLKPEKCTFGIQSGKLLGYLVSHRGIKTNPNKIKVIYEIRAPKESRTSSALMVALQHWGISSPGWVSALSLLQVVEEVGAHSMDHESRRCPTEAQGVSCFTANPRHA
jgi:hypothetical protein